MEIKGERSKFRRNETCEEREEKVFWKPFYMHFYFKRKLKDMAEAALRVLNSQYH